MRIDGKKTFLKKSIYGGLISLIRILNLYSYSTWNSLQPDKQINEAE